MKSYWFVRAKSKLSAMVQLNLALLLAFGLVRVSPATQVRVAEAAPLAGVVVSTPGNVFIGENFSFNVQFSNPSGIPTDVGYGPFVDLLFPFNGADGAAGTSTPDGVDFISATYLGTPVQATVITLTDTDGFTATTDGFAIHPYAFSVSIDSKGKPVRVPAIVTGTAGDKLVVLRLPFGSFVPGQTPVDITVSASLSNLADLNTSLPIRYRGGYMYGATPLDDWCCDPLIASAGADGNTWPASSITPILYTMMKDNPMPEYETATGPNFPRTYIINTDVPTAQLVTNLTVTDTMPNDAQYLTGTITSTPVGSVILDQPLSTGPQNPPNNDLVVRWPVTLTGVAGMDTDTRFNYFYPRVDANGVPLINPLTGGCKTSINTAQSALTWTPVDGRDAPTPIGATTAAPSVSACSLVTQKGMSVITDTGAAGPTPGDVVRVTIDFQVSDFFAVSNMVLTDTLGDGLRFRAITVPTLLVNGNGFALGAANINASNFSVIDHWTGAPVPVAPLNGSTEIVFQVSNELVTRGRPNGNVLGGCVNPAGSVIPDCSAYNDGGTTGRIIFEATILDEFTDTFPSGDRSVDHGDILNNNLLINGAILTTTAGFAPTGFQVNNPSSASLEIAFGGLYKSIYAIGGITSFPLAEIAPGITVTYRITYTMPSSDFENTRITDYLPLPVFKANEVTTYTTPITGTGLPPAGRWQFGPTDTLFEIAGIVPTFTTNSVANTLTWDFGTYDDLLNRDSIIDLLFTVTTDDDPFADGLFLTNQVNVFEGTTNAGNQETNSIVQLRLRQPLLLFNKAVVATDNATASFVPAIPAPVTFNAPGTAGTRWAGNINSTNLAATPINSNITGVDAGDRVTFALVIENTGLSPRGAFDIVISDTLPVGFVIPVGGLNLRASLGDGTALSFVGLGGGPDATANTPDDVFGSGMQLTDDPTVGACQKYEPLSGKNIVIITYDLEVANSAEAGGDIVNTGVLAKYAGDEGGPNHLTTPKEDEAMASVKRPSTTKTLIGTTLTAASNTITQTAIGEIVTYTLAISVPEGTLTNGIITDTLDNGLVFLDMVGVSASPSITTSLSGSFSALLNDGVAVGVNNPLITGGGRVATFNLGTLLNSDNNNVITETVTLTYTAVVLNQAGNDRGVQLNNSAQLGWTATISITGSLTPTAQSLTTVSAANVTIVEPTLTVSKVITPSTADASDVLTYTLRITNTAPSNTEAYNVVLTDVIPANLDYVPGSLVNVAGMAGTLDDSGAPTLTVTWPSLALNASSTLQFSVRISSTVQPGTTLTNTANVQWTSLPGSVLTAQSLYSPVSTERTGNTSNLGGTENDYRTSGSVPVTIQSVSVQKSLVATSEAHTSDVTNPPRVAVGEIIRYRLVITVPESTLINFQIDDNLPGGLQFLDDGTARIAVVADTDYTSVNVGTLPVPAIPMVCRVVAIPVSPPIGNLPCILADGNVGSSNSTSADPDAYGNGTDPQFKFGTFTNNDNDANAELVIMEFNALVLNSTAGSNDAGDNHDNNFAVNINGVQNGPLSNNVRTRVSEPLMTVDKMVTPTTGDAGDVVTYTVTYTNANGANNTTAFDARITDTLPSGLQLNLGSITYTLSSGSTTFTNSSAGNTVDVTAAALPIGVRVTLTYTANLLTSVAPAQILTNTASLAYTSLPGTNGTTSNNTGSSTPGGSGTDTGERNGSGVNQNDHRASDPATVTVSTVTATKTLVTTSEGHTSGADVAIGEIVRYRLAVEIPEGTLTNLQLVDVLPSGLTVLSDTTASFAFVSNGVGITSSVAVVEACTDDVGNAATLGALPQSVVDCAFPAAQISGGPFTTGVDPTFNFGTITNLDSDADAEFVVLEFNALVDNSVAGSNDAGDVVNNAFQVRVNGSTLVTSGNVAVTVREPSITNVNKTASPTTGDAGDTITYTVMYSNAAGVNNTYAFDVRLTDTLPVGLQLNLLSINSTLTGGASGLSNNSAGNTVDITVSNVPIGGGLILTYTAEILPAAVPGQTITNTASVVYTSLPGTNGTTTNPTGSGTPGGSGSDPGERNGSGGHNDYSDSDPASVTITGDAISKSLLSTSAAHTTGAEVTIGEVLTYSLAITLPEGSTPSLVVTDVLPSGLQFITGTVDTAGFNGTLPAPTLTGGVANGDDVTFSFGAITVVNDNVLANNAFRILVQVRVLDVAGNVGVNPPGQTILPNSAQMQAGSAPVTNSAVVNVTVVEPRLVITKDITPSVASPNEVGTVTLTVTNTGTSDAFEVVIVDPVDNTRVVNITPSVTPPGFTFSANTLLTITNVIYTGGDIPTGQARTFAFTAQLAGNLTNGTVLTNTAIVTQATTLPGPDTGERDEPDVFGQDTVLIVTPDMAITKTDNVTNVTPGQALTYTLMYTNVSIVGASGVAITETVPANTTFNAGASLPTVWSCVDGAPGGTACTTAIGSVAANAGGMVTFSVTINNPAPAGVNAITNTASIADDGTKGTDPTPSNNSTTDVDTLTATPDLQISKTDGQTVVTPGQLLTYTLTITNVGNRTATGVQITDTLPANTSFVSASDSGTHLAGVVTWPAFTLAGGNASVSRIVTVQVNNPLAAGVNTITNTAVVADDGAGGVDPTPGNNSTSDVDTVNAAPDLVIVKDDGGATTVPGGVVTYTLVYTNVGNQDATGVLITDVVPANTSFTGTSWSCLPNNSAGSECTLNVGNLNVGASGTASFEVTVNATIPAAVTQISNTAFIGDDGTNGGDPTPSNNADPDDTPLTAEPDMTLTKTDSDVSSTAGGLISYTLTYTNTGNQAATGVTLTETVPANTAFVAAGSTATWSCADGSAAGTTCTLTVGTVSAGMSGTATFVVQVNASVPLNVNLITNMASVGDDGTNGTDSTPNNTSTDTTPLVNIVLEKSVSVGTAVEGQPITYTLVMTNVGSVMLNPVVLTDTLPIGLNFLAGSGTPNDPDTISGQTLTWNSLGSLTPGNAFTVTFAVTAMPGALGTFLNVADVSGLTPSGVVTDTDDVPVVIADPSVIVDKRLVAVDTDLQAPNFVTFTIHITNTGPSVIDVLPVFDIYTPTNLSFVSAVPAPDDNVDDGNLVWSDLTASGAGGYGVNLAPGQAFVITTTFRVVQDITSTTNTAVVQGAIDVFNNNASDVSDAVVVSNIPTAIKLLYFRLGTVSGQAVTLEWATGSEVDNFGFRLFRAASNSFEQAQEIAFVPAASSGATGAQYSYVDTPPTNGTWYYWLVDVDTNGVETRHGPITTAIVPTGPLPYSLFLPLVQR